MGENQSLRDRVENLYSYVTEKILFLEKTDRIDGTNNYKRDCMIYREIREKIKEILEELSDDDFRML